MEVKTLRLKTILTGNFNVGKTSIIKRLCCNAFDKDMKPTIGGPDTSDVYTSNGTKIELVLWDTAGQEKYNCLFPLLYKNSSIVIIVYDPNDSQSFENVTYWVDSVHQYCDKNTVIVVVCNKIDLENQLITKEMATLLCKQYGDIPLMFCSALSSDGVKEVFDFAVNKFYNTKGDKMFAQTNNTTKHHSNVSCGIF
ncbi:Rho GTPase, putative [Entamoeba invadens IP1]|uniref:Rho GTPase, putative n=1 Tax=Entamoeba invadens IP1 TaxID=370355 RepID=A0A0A1TWI4_ENTIV|nr:Rho GTPase, putative [Entamoeba invadens IP1]ELP85510.1 Rho GTPase, putative [Entamoeba invadens IP1]|eukprot:XP_004184856.1 Rho GTPase, putative [Entamoeba invadens IP1]